MTREETCKRKRKVYDAFNAGFITATQCDNKIKEIEKEYYIATHGDFDITTL